jgi:hypothetical protein
MGMMMLCLATGLGAALLAKLPAKTKCTIHLCE